jgi:hypothetical protein
LQDASKCTAGMLPQEALVQVLARLDQRTRLQAAALVCRAWRAAAAAASIEVTAALQNSEDSSRQHSLSMYLAAHGTAVYHLNIIGDLTSAARGSTAAVHTSLVELPCNQLGQLSSCSALRCSIKQCNLRPVSTSTASLYNVSSSSSSNALSGLSSLTALDLESVSLLTFSLEALTALTVLQRLRLVNISAAAASATAQPRGALCLQLLTQLTSVILQPLSMFPEGAVAVFSSLKRLQKLVIDRCSWGSQQPDGPQQEAMLAKLPLSLTRLQLDLPGVRFNKSALPALACLTALQHLKICQQGWNAHPRGVCPNFMSSMQQLRVLRLAQLTALQPLLAAMPSLTRLEVLHLASSGSTPPLPEGQVQQYTALLPPSNTLSTVSIFGSVLPSCGVHHIFAAGRQYPGLTALTLNGCQPVVGERSTQADGITLLAACCPGLQQLCLSDMVQPGENLLPLQQLPSLTRLELDSRVAILNGIRVCPCLFDAGELTQLTGLRHLRRRSAALTAADAMKLTSLSQLTELATTTKFGKGYDWLHRYSEVGKHHERHTMMSYGSWWWCEQGQHSMLQQVPTMLCLFEAFLESSCGKGCRAHVMCRGQIQMMSARSCCWLQGSDPDVWLQLLELLDARKNNRTAFLCQHLRHQFRSKLSRL